MGLRTPGPKQKGLKKLPKKVRNKMGYAKKGRRRKNQMGGPMDPNMQDPNMMPQDPMMDQSMAAPAEDFIEPETQIKFGAPRDKKFFGGKGRARRQARRAARQQGAGAAPMPSQTTSKKTRMPGAGAGMPGRRRRPGMGGGPGMMAKPPGMGGLMGRKRGRGLTPPGMGAGGSEVPNVAQRMKAGPMVQKPGMGAAKNGRYRAQEGKDKRSKYEKFKDEMGQIAAGLKRVVSDERAQGRSTTGKTVNPITEFKKGYTKQEKKDREAATKKSKYGNRRMQTGGNVDADNKKKYAKVKHTGSKTYSTLAGDDKASKEAAVSKKTGKKMVYDREASIKAGAHRYRPAGSSMRYGGSKKKVDTNLPREKALFGKIAGAIGGIKRAKKEGKKLGSGLLKEAAKGALAGGLVGRTAGALQGFFDKDNKGKGLGNRLRQAGAGALGGFNNLANTELAEAARTKGGLKDYLGDKLPFGKGKGDDKPKEDKKPSRQPVAPPMTAMVQTGGRPEDRRKKARSKHDKMLKDNVSGTRKVPTNHWRRQEILKEIQEGREARGARYAPGRNKGARKMESGGYAIESTPSGKKMADTLGVKKNRKRAQTGIRRANKLAQKQKALENQVKKTSVEADSRGETFGQGSKLTKESQKAKAKADKQLRKVQNKRSKGRKKSRIV